jgi:radical SAM protein with 4Fe4S-binding SPASM domain
MNFFLQALQVELTTRCNERCVHCYIPHKTKNRDMDSSLLFDLLEQCHNLGIKKITFSGGEPLLYKDFMTAVDKADWFGFNISIFSNLTLLTDNMIQELKTKHIKDIQASLYSVEPAIHDSITKMPGSCEATKIAVEKLCSNGIPVFISCPVMKQNKQSYAGVLNWAKKLGIGSAPNSMITGCSDRTGDNLENRLSVDEALELIKGILINDSAYEDERFAPGYHDPDVLIPCVQNVCTNFICVNAVGDALPSPGWNYVLGNIQKQSLQDIWENSLAIKSLQNISFNDFPKCRNCPDIHFCGMSLEGNANENRGGNFITIPDHICELARRTRELVHSWHKSQEAC